ncbi:hypothetical protein SLOPH_2114 [Spraguea lophii 42_110]|uniref:Uncharacterized protein n=1 Tax=Spraguea lophii (strain 42_110) TaxID=1358809 RepID=S7W7F4_SPRLO|nr:hypothetical protein SLOPH_2114 [Spraguea lophii 42_110]
MSFIVLGRVHLLYLMVIYLNLYYLFDTTKFVLCLLLLHIDFALFAFKSNYVTITFPPRAYQITFAFRRGYASFTVMILNFHNRNNRILPFFRMIDTGLIYCYVNSKYLFSLIILLFHSSTWISDLRENYLVCIVSVLCQLVLFNVCN